MIDKISSYYDVIICGGGYSRRAAILVNLWSGHVKVEPYKQSNI